MAQKKKKGPPPRQKNVAPKRKKISVANIFFILIAFVMIFAMLVSAFR
jgi:hypothetical protein